MSIELEPKGNVLIGAALFLAFIALYAGMSSSSSGPSWNNGTYIPSNTVKGYELIPPQDAEYLMNTNPSLLIIDANRDTINFQSGAHLPGAIWSTDPSTYYGQNIVMLVYSTPNDFAVQYVRDLIIKGHVQGHLYVLNGGYEAWFNWQNRGT